MFVCSCNVIREKDLVALAAEYPGETTEELYARLGHEPQCGSCLDYADQLVASTARRAARGLSVAPGLTATAADTTTPLQGAA